MDHANSMYSKLSRMQNYGWGELNTTGNVSLCDNMFGAESFYIQEGNLLLCMIFFRVIIFFPLSVDFDVI